MTQDKLGKGLRSWNNTYTKQTGRFLPYYGAYILACLNTYKSSAAWVFLTCRCPEKRSTRTTGQLGRYPLQKKISPNTVLNSSTINIVFLERNHYRVVVFFTCSSADSLRGTQLFL
jgi:hypothetical protein